jgi:3,4-dihydroxy 2-butanone 4-phosphate synthase/GTP cyclohydrolase II
MSVSAVVNGSDATGACPNRSGASSSVPSLANARIGGPGIGGLGPDAQRVIDSMVHGPGSAKNSDPFDSPIRGSSRSIAEITLPLAYGDFRAHVFETAISGRHIVALFKGDISSSEPLLARFHSECITSEGLGGCDCDCVEQLNASLEAIAEEGRGIVFYLRQEGRGAGYHAKARDRMGVAATDNEANTFHMYEALGLPGDPRDYSAVGECAYLLGITAPIRLMTNNPAKLESVAKMGLTPHSHVPLEVQTNPFNHSYLTAKRDAGGHQLKAEGALAVSHFPWPVKVFKPSTVLEAMRFSHEATYPLPIRAFNGEYVIPLTDLEVARQLVAKGPGSDALLAITPVEQERVRIQLHEGKISTLLASNPAHELFTFLNRHTTWFDAHVYHDQLSGLNYVVLEYGGHLADELKRSIVPLVRVQPESILRRFPLANKPTTYEDSVREIVARGRGVIATYPEDGKGNGLAAVFLERQLIQTGLASSPEEACKLIGTAPDPRDYGPIARLISRHFGKGPVELILRERNKNPNRPIGDLIGQLTENGVTLGEHKFL